jgi:hypothetical protein
MTIPEFGRAHQDSFSSKKKENEKDPNFSFGEESNNEDNNEQILQSNLLNDSFGDKNNNF